MKKFILSLIAVLVIQTGFVIPYSTHAAEESPQPIGISEAADEPVSKIAEIQPS